MHAVDQSMLEGRNPSTVNLARWFDYEHLAAGLPKDTSMTCAVLANSMIHELPDSPELSAGLRKLLEAKDAFVRAAIEATGAADSGFERVRGDLVTPEAAS